MKKKNNMENFVSQFGGWLGIISIVVVGVLAVAGFFNKENKKLKEEEKTTAKDIIDLLSKKVTILETKVGELETKVDTLTAENRTLRDVLQGRDSITQQFYKDTYVAIKIIEHNDKVSEENSKTLSRIAVLLETLVKINAKAV